MAKNVGMHPKTVGKAVKIIGKASRIRTKRHLLTAGQKEIRLNRSKKLLNLLKSKSPSTVIIYADKKMFTVDQAYNRRNDRVVVDVDAEVTPVMTTKHPAGVMMLGVIASDGEKMPPHFFPSGLKINTEVYMRVLRTKVKPWVEATYPEKDVIWQQDSALPHGAKLTQAWLAKNLPGFWSKEIWPISSPKYRIPLLWYLGTLEPLSHYYQNINAELLIIKSLLVSQLKLKCHNNGNFIQ